MPLPGPKQSCTLRTVSRSKGADMKITETTTDLVTFNAVIAPLTVNERYLMGKQTARSPHRMMVEFSQLGGNEDSLVEKSRIVIGSTVYEITGVEDYHGGSVGRHYEVYLEELE